MFLVFVTALHFAAIVEVYLAIFLYLPWVLPVFPAVGFRFRHPVSAINAVYTSTKEGGLVWFHECRSGNKWVWTPFGTGVESI
ncbi:hypothetical protein BDV40DRAFT_251400 [Aspergillus tamarii]|uniref:Uncharacterized protein n=1 Tax=Aspergillus tamarii TaxID=41984 RepID=A0A5N6VAV7_ASPTM|nr:hypothetical protein BDV40DRAFT_251400 [Aspergillus tamarii]